MTKSNNNKIAAYKVKRCYTNFFAQTCYELENGATIYIDYSGDRLTIEQPDKQDEQAEKQAQKRAALLYKLN